MRHKLQFINPQWHYGSNTTVRLGLKWHDKAAVGDIVEIVRTGYESMVLSEGEITCIRAVPFMELPIFTLIEEHDRECSSYQGLIHAMLRAYPEFTLDSYVTLLIFKI